jgi:hypothetical protein
MKTEIRRMQFIAGLITESEYLKSLDENQSEDFKIIDNKIEGSKCIDFNPKQLKPGDIIYRKLVDVDNWINNWAKDKNKLSGVGLSSYATPDQYKVISIQGDILKMEEVKK